jgi:MFS family permease
MRRATAGGGRALPGMVVVIGLVSLFNEIASQIVTPLIPILLVTVLGAGPVALGIVEGVADAVACFLRLWSGRLSDALGAKRKGLMLIGYAVANAAKPLIALAVSWWIVAALRTADRVGKGLRSAPRDALVADITPNEIRGRAYGVQRALDRTGAVGGSLIAAAVLAWSGIGITEVILLSAIPGLIAVLLIVFFIRDPAPAEPVHAPQVKVELRWAELSPELRRFFPVLAVFGLARASETFILLRGHELGMSVVELLLMWATLNLVQSGSALVGGRIADRTGAFFMVCFSWTAFGATFMLLALASSASFLWGAALVYGSLSAMGEGVERSLVAGFAGARQRGTSFGWYNMTLGLAAIPSGVLFGTIWLFAGAPWAFLTSAVLALIAAAGVVIGMRPRAATARR